MNQPEAPRRPLSRLVIELIGSWRIDMVRAWMRLSVRSGTPSALRSTSPVLVSSISMAMKSLRLPWLTEYWRMRYLTSTPRVVGVRPSYICTWRLSGSTQRVPSSAVATSARCIAGR